MQVGLISIKAKFTINMGVESSMTFTKAKHRITHIYSEVGLFKRSVSFPQHPALFNTKSYKYQRNVVGFRNILVMHIAN